MGEDAAIKRRTARRTSSSSANTAITFTDDPSVAGLDRTVQNTTPLAFAGKLFTLKEDSLPYEIDCNTFGDDRSL